MTSVNTIYSDAGNEVTLLTESCNDMFYEWSDSAPCGDVPLKMLAYTDVPVSDATWTTPLSGNMLIFHIQGIAEDGSKHMLTSEHFHIGDELMINNVICTIANVAITRHDFTSGAVNDIMHEASGDDIYSV